MCSHVCVHFHLTTAHILMFPALLVILNTSSMNSESSSWDFYCKFFQLKYIMVLPPSVFFLLAKISLIKEQQQRKIIFILKIKFDFTNIKSKYS